MKTLTFIYCLCLTAIFVGCSPISVSHDYDPQTNFSNLKTFSWLPFPEKTVFNQLVVERIKKAVTAELSFKGLSQNSQRPDFLIAMYGATKEKLDINDWGYNDGPRALGWGERNIDVRQYTEGTIILDFIDPKSRNLIWRGEAKAAIDPNASPDKRRKRINEGVAKLLASFPPAP